ncbi:hypothetical protein GCM10027614_74910 [Micromonospora vulcania]
MPRETTNPVTEYREPAVESERGALVAVLVMVILGVAGILRSPEAAPALPRCTGAPAPNSVTDLGQGRVPWPPVCGSRSVGITPSRPA